MYHYYKSVFVDGFEGGYPMHWDEPIKSFIRTQLEAAREKTLAGCLDEMKTLIEEGADYADVLKSWETRLSALKENKS